MNSHRSAHELPGLRHVLVDGFRHRMESIKDPKDRFYFLTHFHSDHYGGLSSSWRHGRIVCSRITRDLLVHIMGVGEKWIACVDVDGSIVIPQCEVTFLDANHCPGAVLLLFKIRDTHSNSDISSGSSNSSNSSLAPSPDPNPNPPAGPCKYFLHTGDMRYHPCMQTYPALRGIQIEKIFLDTTYAHPKHTFITQAESISLIVTAARAHLAAHPDSIILLGAYNIGKERVICGLQDALGVSVYMEEDKLKLMRCLGPDIAERVRSGRFTSDPRRARVHVCRMGFPGTMHPYFKPNFANLEALRDQMNGAEGEEGDLYLDIKDQEQEEGEEKGEGGLVEGEGEGGVVDADSEDREGDREGAEGEGDAVQGTSTSSTSVCTSDTPSTSMSGGCVDSIREQPQCPAPSSSSSPSPPITRVTHILAFLPTGWAASSPFNARNSSMERDGLTVTAVPYSEHSQCRELLEFVTFLRPRQVLPTVFSDEKNRLFILDLFRNCVDRTANMKSFIDKMTPKPPAKTPKISMPGDIEIAVDQRKIETFTGELIINKKRKIARSEISSSGSKAVKNRNNDRGSNGNSNSNSNNGSNTVCMLSDDEEEEEGHGEGQSGGGGSIAVRVADNMWVCSVCTYRHSTDREGGFLQCGVCGADRPADPDNDRRTS